MRIDTFAHGSVTSCIATSLLNMPQYLPQCLVFKIHTLIYGDIITNLCIAAQETTITPSTEKPTTSKEIKSTGIYY